MKNQRVHILTSGACTNACIFCMDKKEDRKYISREELLKNLKNGLKFSKEVTFTSGEPTIHPDILEFVAISKSLAYKTIQIVSNGRKYKDLDFVKSLYNQGVTDFVVSIHSYNEKKHDNIVKKNQAFKETLLGLINLSKLKKIYNFVLNTNTTIIRQNYKDIEKIVKLLEKFPIDSIVLNVVIPGEKANKNNTIVKYTALVKELEKLISFQKKYKNIYINGIPYCLSKNLTTMIGFREAIIFSQDEEEFVRFSDNQIVNNNNKKHINGKIKSKNCINCKYNNICEGVWQSYIDIYGWDEFLPIK